MHLPDMGIERWLSPVCDWFFEAGDRCSSDVKWTVSRADIICESNAKLRAIAAIYASDDIHETFVTNFVAAWNKVIRLDRFTLARTQT